MSDNATQLYDEDFVRWTEEQAQALRQAAELATNLSLDWANLAEEIDSLGQSQRNELGSRLAVILEYLIKLETSPAGDPRSGWMDTIDRERPAVERLLQQSPNLRGRGESDDFSGNASGRALGISQPSPPRGDNCGRRPTTQRSKLHRGSGAGRLVPGRHLSLLAS